MSSVTVILASDVLKQLSQSCSLALTDEQIAAQCPACGPVALSSCWIVGGAETAYACRCGHILLKIGVPNENARPWPGRGYRIGGFVLRNSVALAFDGVRLAASPAALAPEREPDPSADRRLLPL